MRPVIVHRPRLLEKLDAGLYRSLTLISAPAGFGKTTLAAEWLKHISLKNQHAGIEINRSWLSIDEQDNDSTRFLEYFITTIRNCSQPDLDLGSTALNMIQSSQQIPHETILTSLINDITSNNMKMVVVLDDYHMIDSRTVDQILSFWINNAPPQVHLVILTREDPQLPIARLRAKDQLTELRATDLRLTNMESDRFLNIVMELKLESEQISKLEQRTEGWIAGLQMAGLYIRECSNVDHFIEKFSGTNRYILDYLLEEVLAGQSPEIQRFLLHTSVLRKLSAPLCDAVLENKTNKINLSNHEIQPTSIFDYLDKANLFLVALGDDRIWYRYHYLFADLLKARLHKTFSKNEISNLHKRAANWHEQNGSIYEAIHHASLTSDNEWVERLIEQNYMDILQRSDSRSVRYFGAELSRELVFKRPLLCVYEAMGRSWIGALDDADFYLSRAEEGIERADKSPETAAIKGHIAYIRSRITAMRGDYKQAEALCLYAKEHTPSDDYALVVAIGVMLGYVYFLDGDFANASETLKETINLGVNNGAINSTVGAYCVLARLHTIRGELHKAYDLYQEAYEYLTAIEGFPKGTVSILETGKAEILYEWNDLEVARTHLDRGIKSMMYWSKTDDIVLAYTTLAKVQQAESDLSGALETMDDASRLVEANGVFSESRTVANSIRANLLLKQGSSTSKTIEYDPESSDTLDFENELVSITKAKYLLSHDEVHRCLDLLARLEGNAETNKRKGRLVQIYILKALAMKQAGDSKQAYFALAKSLSLAEPEGYLRVYLDEGQPLKELLSDWEAESSASSLHDYARRILAEFENQNVTSTTKLPTHQTPISLIEPLSPRETEVLQQIATGKTNQEIARHLYVSPGTIKAHTSSIYRKLEVANRTESVARARELQILS